MDFILEILSDPVKDKVGKCSSTKYLWDKLHNLYSKGSHNVTEPEHIKKDTRTKREERYLSCQTNLEEEYCDECIVNLEAEVINTLDDLVKERRKNMSLKE